jgi:hypothetical protein
MSNEQQPKGPIGLTRAEEAHFPAMPTGPKPVDRNAPKCVACGQYHGSVNVVRACLERKVIEQRDEIQALERRLRLERAGRGPAEKTDVESEPKPA